MRLQVPEYIVKTPAGLEEALQILAEEPGVWRPMAGGTDVMVPPPHVPEHTCYLNLQSLDELRGIRFDEEGVVIGALTTYTELRESRGIHEMFPNLIKSAKATAALAIQNRGTLGGNIMNGSPAADTPPSLMAYGAEVELSSIRGTRWVELDRFWTGYKAFDRQSDELLTRIRIRRPEGWSFHFYRKVGSRAAQAISKASFAAYAQIEQGKVQVFRVAVGAVAPSCVRARHAEAVVLGRPLAALPIQEARRAIQEDICPIDDFRSTAEYRRLVISNVLGQMLEELAALGH